MDNVQGEVLLTKLLKSPLIWGWFLTAAYAAYLAASESQGVLILPVFLCLHQAILHARLILSGTPEPTPALVLAMMTKSPMIWIFLLIGARMAYLTASGSNPITLVGVGMCLCIVVSHARFLRDGRAAPTPAQLRTLSIVRKIFTPTAFVIVPAWWFFLGSGGVEFHGSALVEILVLSLPTFIVLLWIMPLIHSLITPLLEAGGGGGAHGMEGRATRHESNHRPRAGL